MKNQYFGDFGDYQKFSLLKTLRDVGDFKIVVHWMKTPDDGGTDGKRITYLENPELWAEHDRDIFDFIKECISNRRRDLAIYEQSQHAQGMRFLSEYMSKANRHILLKEIQNDKISNLVFFDPDNGIEVKSTSPRTIHKYVLRNDLHVAFDSGKSVLVYQHFSRKNRDIFIDEKLKHLNKEFAAQTFSIRVKHSVYFLIAQHRHTQKLQTSLKAYQAIWNLTD